MEMPAESCIAILVTRTVTLVLGRRSVDVTSSYVYLGVVSGMRVPGCQPALMGDTYEHNLFLQNQRCAKCWRENSSPILMLTNFWNCSVPCFFRGVRVHLPYFQGVLRSTNLLKFFSY